MKIIIITQNEPFFLARNIKYLVKKLPKDVNIVGIILYEPSPFGKNQSLVKKGLRTLRLFGLKFFLFYFLKFILSKFDSTKNVEKTIKKLDLNIIKLKNSINHKKSLDLIKSYKPDLLVSILGSEIFKKNLLQIAPKGCINLHSSLLPKYRGLMPTFWVLKNREKYTGVSVFFVDNGIDSGPIIIQRKIKLENLTQSQLIKMSKSIGMDLIANAINQVKNDELSLISNPDNNSSYYSFPNRSDIKDFLAKGNKFF